MVIVILDEICYDEVVSYLENVERFIGFFLDELWLCVLRLGVDGGFLDYKDFCFLLCVSYWFFCFFLFDFIW